MLEQSSPVLSSPYGHAIPLKNVDIQAKIEGLVTDICVTQHYINQENINIEAIYTFPLPIDAVLLSLVVTLGERVLNAEIIEKKEAEARYEDAITDGDTTIMLEKLESGMYTMNIGNLMPEEEIAIELNYAFIQRWQGNQLRLFIPTTIAPRYGDSPFKQHQTPETNVYAEYSYQFYLKIIGDLSTASIASPSHELSIVREYNSAEVIIKNEKSLMDKDFVLTIESEQNHQFGLMAKEGDGYCALASFHPSFELAKEQEPSNIKQSIKRFYNRLNSSNHSDVKPKNIKIVVDCSGSMMGVSIQQARDALLKIVSSLNENDLFNITLFGSDSNSFFDGMVLAKPRNKTYAVHEINKLNANMGGTNIGPALQNAYRDEGKPDYENDILLITDGEVFQYDDIFAHAKRSSHRIFTVGVGSAVAENFVRTLATITGGACELVSPNEVMSERIVRHFNRMRQPQATKVEIKWSQKPLYQLDIGPVHNGDTVNVFAGFSEELEGAKAELLLHMPDGNTLTQEVTINQSIDRNEKNIANESQIAPLPFSQLSRIAAAARIEACHEVDDIVNLACRYQLMSKYTNCLMVDKRDNPTEDLPQLRKVPQMTPDNYSDLDPFAISACAVPRDASSPFDVKIDPLAMADTPRKKRGLGTDFCAAGVSGVDESIIPDNWDDPLAVSDRLEQVSIDSSFGLTGSDDSTQTKGKTAIEFLQDILGKNSQVNPMPVSLKAFIAYGIPSTVANFLQKISSEGFGEKYISICYMAILLDIYKTEASIDRDLARMIIKAYKNQNISELLIQKINEAVKQHVNLFEVETY